jgi:hypothetical protein
VPGEHLPDELRLRELPEEAVLERGVDLVGVPEAELLFAQAGAEAERFVDELAGQHRGA